MGNLGAAATKDAERLAVVEATTDRIEAAVANLHDAVTPLITLAPKLQGLCDRYDEITQAADVRRDWKVVRRVARRWLAGPRAATVVAASSLISAVVWTLADHHIPVP